MAAVSIEIFGVITLSTDAEHGRACLVEAPKITAARFRIGDPVSSDQSCSARLVALPDVRRALSGAVADWATLRLSVALGRDETRAYLDAAFPGGVEVAWIRSERVEVTGRGYISDPDSPFYQRYYIDIVRGTQGTVRGRYRLDVPDGLGAYVTPGPLPRDPAGLWAVVRRHRAHHEPDPGTRDMFFGQISRVIDAGDTIEIELQSGIEELLETSWPRILGVYPHAQAYFDIIAPGWPDNDWAAAPMFGRGPADNAFLNRLGPIWPGGWYPTGALVGAGPALGAWPEDILAFEDALYTRSPAEPDDYSAWRAVIVEGAGGYTGYARPDSARRDVERAEYIPIALREGTSTDPLASYTYDLDATFIPSPIGDYSPEPSGWSVPRTRPAPMDRRTGRLDGGVSGDAEYRAPSVLRTGRYYRALAWRTPGGDYSVPPALYSSYVLGQLTWPGHPSGVTGTHSIDADLGLATQYCVDLTRTRDVFLRVDLRAGVVPSPLRFPAGRLTGVDRGHTYIWPPEMWADRKIRDTVFGDMWTMHAVAWAPGESGRLRPVWLADESVSPVATIGPREVRDRDATLLHEYALPLASVEISGFHAAPLTERVAPDAPGDEPSQKLGGIDVIRVESEDVAGGLTGRSLSLKASTYHARDGLTISSSSVDAHDPRHIKRQIRDTWRRVMRRFGAPVPELTLRIDADVRAWPGDYVSLTLPAVRDKRGLPMEGMEALMLERGDDLATGTAECTFLLTGWHPEPFHPSQLSPLVWLDPSDMTTLFVDSAGTTPVVASGDPVGRWKNKGTSGAVGDAVQTVSANRPLYGDRVVTFDGAGSRMALGYSPTLPQSVYMHADRYGPPPAGGAPRIIATPTTLPYVQLIDTSTGVSAFFSEGGSASGSATNIAGRSSKTVGAEFAQGLLRSWIRGTSASGALSTPASNFTAAGAWNLNLNGTVQYRCGHVFIFDRILTDDERTKLLAWMEAQ